ncbi:MAG: hypothetical protein IJI73_08105 [Kiritimatiellae bacterium]|nr:hypothetical protein [Kiritimatiellia bacterium]
MKRFLRYAWKTVKWSFIVFLIFVASLYFREQRLPRALVGWIADRLSSESHVVRCDSATIGLRHGVTLSSVRVYDRRRQEMEAMVSAKSVSANHVTRRVRVVGLRYPRLPESYYSGECRERNERVEMEFPGLPAFRLELEDAEVLGVAASRLTAEVAVSPGSLRVDDIHGELSGGDRRRPVEGSFELDIPSQRVRAEVGGQVAMNQVRPLLVALDIPSALRYFDAFTEMEAPVPATGAFVVNLANGDFGMKLDLAPTLGKYNGVPLSKADGTLDLYVYTRGTNCNARFSVDLRSAEDERGRRLSGGILVDYTNDVTRLVFTDVKCGLRLRDALEIADFIKPETLDVIECETPPEITVKGMCGTTAEDRGVNSMDFTAKVRHGSFLGLRLNDVLAEFSLRGDVLSFPVVSATGKTGGSFLASADVAIPEFDGDRAGFKLKVDYRRGSLEELADFFKFDLGERNGKVQGWCEFEGPVSSNLLSRLNGRGSVKVTDGHLAQMKLFAGLTAMLADKVPGVGFLVNQSQASADFTVTNGLFRSDNVFIEGGLISIKGWGSYDIPRDNLDYTVRVQFLKNDSLMGKIVHPITWPFTKLLLEFRATGPIDSPKWEYISLLDRIL